MHSMLRLRNWRRVLVLSLVGSMLLTYALVPAAVSASSDGVDPSSPAGDLIGGLITFASPSANKANPGVAWNSANNEYLAAWDLVYSAWEVGVAAGRFSATGAALGPAVTVLAYGINHHHSRVIYNPDRNEYLVVLDDGASLVRAQRISAAGALLGGSITISTGGQAWGAQAVYNPDAREYMITLQSNISGGNISNIYVQRLSATGTLLGGILAVTGGPGDTGSPAITYNRTAREYLVIWTDKRNGTDYDIYGQRIGPDGATLGPQFAVAATWGNQVSPAVAWDSKHSAYLVAWQDTRNGANYDIYGQRLTGNATLMGGNFPISTGSGDQYGWATRLAWNPANDEYLVAWDDNNVIYGQRVTHAGALRNARITIGNGFRVSDALYNAVAREYLVTWGWIGAYGQRVAGQPTFCSSVTEIPKGECEALVAFHGDMGGPGWTNRSGWLASSTPCTWYGVTCANGHVTRLELNQNLLRGNLSGQLGNLRYLQRLSLYGNQITGAIPAELSNLVDLQYITLASNQLSGTIPAWFGNLGNLTYFNLNSNQLSGTIPPALGNLTQLATLELCANQLTGSIPSTLGNLVNLTQLNMYYNHLSGPIPPELGRLSRLIWLGLDNNELNGPIPGELAKSDEFAQLQLAEQSPYGIVPFLVG